MEKINRKRYENSKMDFLKEEQVLQFFLNHTNLVYQLFKSSIIPKILNKL